MLICGPFRSAWDMLRILAVVARSAVETLASGERRDLGRLEPSAWDYIVCVCCVIGHFCRYYDVGLT